jgi:hypothetical protein
MGACALERCIDELDECMDRLDGCNPGVLALALRTHLAGLLRAMLDEGACTPRQARRFLRVLTHEALDPG